MLKYSLYKWTKALSDIYFVTLRKAIRYDVNMALIKRRFHFHVAAHLICPWSFTSLTSFHCFFKPISISWSNFYQLHVLMFTLRTHDIMILGGINGKLASENFFWKWISRGRRKWWNDCSKLSLIAIEKSTQSWSIRMLDNITMDTKLTLLILASKHFFSQLVRFLN